MISNELKGIIEKIKKQGNMNFFESVSEEEIKKFEEDKKIKLPLKFKEWLSFSDGGDFYSDRNYITSIYG